jgi:hypothetical protein
MLPSIVAKTQPAPALNTELLELFEQFFELDGEYRK